MSQDSADSSQRLLPPSEAESETGMLRWIVAAGLVLALIVGAYHAYEWLVSDIAQRRAVAEGSAPDPTPSPAPAAVTTPPPSPAPAPARTQPQPPAPSTAAGDPPMPAVTGGGVNKCVQGGQVTYTSSPCPEGSEPVPLAAAGIDPNGVLGSTGDDAPVAVAAPAVFAAGGDPGQSDARCRYLAAEVERLDFEFKQALPPQVLDHISSRLVVLRAQGEAGHCGPLTKPAAKPAPSAPAKRPARKVVEEKADE